MTNKTEIENAAKARKLELMIKQTELGADLENVLKELIPPDNPWWAGQNLAEAAKVPLQQASDHLPWFNRVSSVVGVAADWTRLAARHFSHDNTWNGTVMGAAAASSARRKPVMSNHCTWRQGDLVLTLALHNDDVTLSIDDGPDVDIDQLGWIDEEALDGDLQAVPLLHRFDVSRTGARLFAVNARSGDVSDRFSAIKSVENSGVGGLHAFLPFVEWN